MAGRPARNKIDIEALLTWAVCREFAHIHAEQSGLLPAEAAAAGLPPNAISGDGCASLKRIAGLGCRPDGGVGLGGGHCHIDAEVAYITARRVFERDRPSFGLIMEFAKLNDRPGWGSHIREVEAFPKVALGRRGMLRVVVLRPRGSLGFCPVEFRDRGAEILAARMLYRAWWVALSRIAQALRREDRLIRHEVTGPGAPERPWEA